MYMRHGTFEQAVGPLARAIELAPGREDLWYELLLALNLAGLDRQMVDLTAKAREFADMVEMAGHSC